MHACIDNWLHAGYFFETIVLDKPYRKLHLSVTSWSLFFTVKVQMKTVKASQKCVVLPPLPPTH